jgi:hypothetical protein
LGSLEDGRLPKKMSKPDLNANLILLVNTLRQLLDTDLIPWLASPHVVNAHERDRAASVIADRLCGAMSDPIIRNAQEER